MIEGLQEATVEKERAVRQSRLDKALGEVPFYALLLPIYSVLLLYADNVIDVAPVEVAGPLVVVMGVAALGLAILARLWNSWARAGLVMAATLVPFLLAGLVVDLLEPDWPDDFLLRLHVVVVVGWFTVAILGVYFALKLGSNLRVVTQLLNIVSLVLLVLATVPVVGDLRGAAAMPGSGSPLSTNADVIGAQVGESEPRDIFHLVFDRYGSERSLALGRGIDNSELIDWLRERGFQVVDDARANFERTALSLSSVHDMSLHEDLAQAEHASYDMLVDRIRSSRAAAALKELGYEYVVVGSWWGPSAYSNLADHTIEPRFVMSFGSALVDRSLLPSLEAIAAFATSASVDGSARQLASTTENQFLSLASLAGRPGPQLVFAHFLVPHEPYVFLADGTVDSDEASFETQLSYTNEQLKGLVEILQDVPVDTQPIIILQADEGPYPGRYGAGRNDFDWSTASDEELVTKFGVLDAFYLPGAEGEPALRKGLSLVNTYPEFLRRYYGLEVGDVADRTYAMVDGDYFNLVDITERVDAAFERLVPVGGELPIEQSSGAFRELRAREYRERAHPPGGWHR